MGIKSFDVEKIAIELVMTDNVIKKRQLAKKISMISIWLAVKVNSLVLQSLP